RLPVALAAVGLVGQARLMNRLILGCQRGLLTSAPRLGRVERRLSAGPKVNPAPHAEEVRIFRIIEGLGRRYRRQQPPNRNRDRPSEKHGCSPCDQDPRAASGGPRRPKGTVAVTVPA